MLSKLEVLTQGTMTNWTRRLVRRLRALIHRDSLDRDVDDEMRLHIEMEANEIARVHGDGSQALYKLLADGLVTMVHALASCRWTKRQ